MSNNNELYVKLVVPEKDEYWETYYYKYAFKSNCGNECWDKVNQYGESLGCGMYEKTILELLYTERAYICHKQPIFQKKPEWPRVFSYAHGFIRFKDDKDYGLNYSYITGDSYTGGQNIRCYIEMNKNNEVIEILAERRKKLLSLINE